MSKARSARTGQYVTKAKAAKRPNTTVVEKKRPSVKRLKSLLKGLKEDAYDRGDLELVEYYIKELTDYLAKFK